MKNNLSSQIKLDQVPKKYYAPENKLEFAEPTKPTSTQPEGLTLPFAKSAHPATSLSTSRARNNHQVAACRSSAARHAAQ